MNLSVLEKGKTFKNYKVLCKELEIKPMSSNSKKAQLKELERYCKYSKIGHQFKILDVYDSPLEKTDNRGGNNNVYGNMIKVLITDLLAQCPQGHISISRSKLLFTINMINSNYSVGNENVPKLSRYTNIQEGIIYDFYNTSNGSFKSSIETALKNLMDERLIMFEIIIKVCDKTNKHRPATHEEKELIAYLEREVLEELDYNCISDVRISRHWKLFKTKVQKLINNNSKLKYYYFAYDITINQKHIKEQQKEIHDLLLEDAEREDYKSELNTTVYNKIIENANKRKNEGSAESKMSLYRMSRRYMEDIKKLSNLLIDEGVENIVNELEKVEYDYFEDDMINELMQ